MKTLGLRILALFFLVAGGTAAWGQDRDAEVPGDYFSLEGALELFKKSSSPEEFERMLNAENSKVNNLDLNGDGYIDYLRVIDRTERNVHAFTIQAVISDTELQDVAVIELEKLANGKAVLQITGDEDVYGTETIIEPTEEVRINAGTTTTRTVVNVWAWPSVQYVYGPYYTVWVSPWGWHARPVWWRTWRPVAYYHYDSWWHPYRPYYARCHTHRVVYAHRIYRPHRSTSVIVTNRHRTQLASYRSTHRETGNQQRYSEPRPRTRSDYRSENSRPVVRTRERASEPTDRTRFESADTRRSATQPRADRERTEPRQRHAVIRQPEEPRKTWQHERQPTERRSGTQVNRAPQQRTAPVVRQERNRTSGGGSKATQPRGLSKRSR